MFAALWCVFVCVRAHAISTSPVLWLAAPSSPLHPFPSLPQRKPAIQSGTEIRSLRVWPGLRPLANEVGERQAKSLPLGLYCLYRGLVIGGYGSGIKRLLPQPVRRVRHSLPPLLLFLPPILPPPPSSLYSFQKEKKWAPNEIGSIHGLLPHPVLPLPDSLRPCLLCLPHIMSVVWCPGCWFSCSPCCLAKWVCGCWLCCSMVGGLMPSVRDVQCWAGSFVEVSASLISISSFSLFQDSYTMPLTSIQCWHVHCEECWLRTLVRTHTFAHTLSPNGV